MPDTQIKNLYHKPELRNRAWDTSYWQTVEKSAASAI
nr:MAG TPA: hypothetical protein [Caudoviricetes sp.]